MKKLEVLQNLDFGNQIAEEEKDTLKDYFVEIVLMGKKFFAGRLT